MQQFNAQFVRDYFKPFLLDVLADMATPTEEAEKGIYLKKLLRGEKLIERDKNRFEQEYFIQPKTQTGRKAVLPIFTEETESDFREYFLEDLGKLIKSRIRLSNKKGMRDALLPNETNQYGVNKTFTRNINRMTQQMIMSFEKRLLIKQDGNKEQIENGKLRLVQRDGKLVAVTEEEISDSDVPFMAPGLSEAIYSGEGVSDKPETPQNKAFKGSELKADFAKVQAATVEKLLEESGLEVVEEIKIRDGIAEGTVKDAEGQELTVRIDTTKPNYDPGKFTFIFKSYGPKRDLAGKEIKSNQKDIRAIFFDEKGRKTAANAYKDQEVRKSQALPGKPGEVPKVGQYRPVIGGGIPATEEERPGIALPKGAKGGTIVSGSGTINLPATPPVIPKGLLGAQAKGKIPTSAALRLKTKKPISAPKPKTVMAQKQAVNKQKTIKPPAPLEMNPRARQLAAGDRRAKAQNRKTKRRKGAAVGAIGGGIGTLLWGAGNSAKAAVAPKVAGVAIKTVLYCLGIDCVG